jgi:glycosyltransferase involved in cell wall biosynthesis
MPNNLEAIEWYLKNIHKDVLKVFPKYKFIIAGSTGKYSKSYFDSKFSNIPAVEVYFDLDSLDFVYDKASVFVNPMRHGAGVKIKSIHSIINGLPLVSTKTGSEGIGLTDGVNFLHGETKTEFINGVMAMLKDKPLREKIALGGQAFLKENNSEKILEDELFTIFK